MAKDNQRTMIAYDDRKGEWLFTTNIDWHMEKIEDEIDYRKVRYDRDKDGNKIRMTAKINNLKYLGWFFESLEEDKLKGNESNES
jgi:hypothetical protein